LLATASPPPPSTEAGPTVSRFMSVWPEAITGLSPVFWIWSLVMKFEIRLAFPAVVTL